MTRKPKQKTAVDPQRQLERSVSGQFAKGTIITPTLNSLFYAVVRYTDTANNLLAVTVKGNQGSEWEESWNLEHTIAGVNRRDYKLSR